MSVRVAALNEKRSSVSEMSWQPTDFVELGLRVALFNLGLCDSLAQIVKAPPCQETPQGWRRGVGGDEPAGPSSGPPCEKSATEAESHK